MMICIMDLFIGSLNLSKCSGLETSSEIQERIDVASFWSKYSQNKKFQKMIIKKSINKFVDLDNYHDKGERL